MFRGKDRLRPSWPVFLVVGLVLIAKLVVGYRRLGHDGVFWLLGVSAVILVLAIGTARRAWTAVGPAGITICWGIGRRGRTYPWREIRWIDVREKTGRYETRSVQITLANGRRRTLAALQQTSAYPQPTLDADFRRIVDWWVLSTDPAARFQPPKSLGSRLGPTMPAVILALLIVAGVGFAAAIRS